MLTPLKCLIEISKKIERETSSQETIQDDVRLIQNTAQLILGQVKGNLDRNLLNENMFEA